MKYINLIVISHNNITEFTACIHTKEFNFFKDYFLNTKKNVYAYSDYEKKVIEKMVARKIRSIESVKRANLEGNHVTVDEDILEKEDVNMFVDIPTTLLHELKKYHY